MRSSKVFLSAALAVTALTVWPQVAGGADKPEAVRQFLEAFNAHDATAMAELVADDIKWLSVDDTTVAVELEGKAPFVQAMNDYFSSCPSCRSEIHGLISSSERVSTVEVASWAVRDGRSSQRAVAIYEFSGPLIHAVYYFPEEPDRNSSK